MTNSVQCSHNLETNEGFSFTKYNTGRLFSITPPILHFKLCKLTDLSMILTEKPFISRDGHSKWVMMLFAKATFCVAHKTDFH